MQVSSVVFGCGALGAESLWVVVNPTFLWTYLRHQTVWVSLASGLEFVLQHL
jgi:hypothetical protein